MVLFEKKQEKLRVVAYCRVSTNSEEQLESLKIQQAYFGRTIQENPNWQFIKIYSDVSSALRMKELPGYQQMILDSEKGLFDLLFVKSLSRFGRNIVETLIQIRKWKQMKIGVSAEIENINTLNMDDSILRVLVGIGQEESRAKSENIKFGIQRRMRIGKTILNHSQFLGYTKGSDGILKVVPEEAEIVKKIFDLYIAGNGVRKIKRYLEEHGIKTVTGKGIWSTSTIDRILSNEKYVGQILMQKNYTSDVMTGKQERNEDQLPMVLVENAHEPIIDRKTFDLVQEMKGHIKKL